MNIGAIVGTLITMGLGGVLWFCADRLLYWGLQTYNLVGWFHTVGTEANYILRKINEKAPESAKLLQGQLVTEADEFKVEVLKPFDTK